MLDDLGQDLLDALVGDWGGLAECVDGAAGGDGREECVGAHFVWFVLKRGGFVGGG